MAERKEIRRRARHVLKAHYWVFVAACLMAAILGTEYTNSLQLLRLQRRAHEGQTSAAAPALGVGASSGEMSVFNDIINGDLDGAIRSVRHRILQNPHRWRPDIKLFPSPKGSGFPPAKPKGSYL